MIGAPKHIKLFLFFLFQSSKSILPTSLHRLYHPLVIWFNLQILPLKPQNFGFYHQSVRLPEKPHQLHPFLPQIELFFISFICFHLCLAPPLTLSSRNWCSQVSFFTPRLSYAAFTRLFFFRIPRQKTHPGTCLCWILLCRSYFDLKWSSPRMPKEPIQDSFFNGLLSSLLYILALKQRRISQS